MKPCFIFICLSFMVSAKQQKKGNKRQVDDYEEDTHVDFSDTVLELRGSIRKSFALICPADQNFDHDSHSPQRLAIGAGDNIVLKYLRGHNSTSYSFKEAASLDSTKSMICSPLSVLMPLGKLTLGAERRSEKELLSAIGLSSKSQIRTSFSQLISNMEFLPGVRLDVASRIYVSTKRALNHKFVKETKTIFRSTVQKMKTSDPDRTASEINDWVAENTKNKITRLVSPDDITESTSVILVNAIYFAGHWKTQFSKTFTGKFAAPYEKLELQMMSQNGAYNYWGCNILQAQIVEIPYEGEQSSMIVVLPVAINGLPHLLRALKNDPELLNQALEKMKSTDVIITMPKFKIETEMNLNSLLKKVGLRSIFESRSDLTGIVKGQTVVVSKAIHKAVIEVNEQGTEAAASTAVYVNLKYEELTRFEAKHPFYFIIRAYNEQLFVGIFSG